MEMSKNAMSKRAVYGLGARFNHVRVPFKKLLKSVKGNKFKNLFKPLTIKPKIT